MSQPIVPGRLPDAERDAIMRRALSDLRFRGYQIEHVDGIRAVVSTGQPVNHVLHVLLTVFTCGLWALIWLILVATGGVKRRHIYVDYYGNVMGLGSSAATPPAP